MTAIEYLEARNRMTEYCGIFCVDCPLCSRHNGKGVSCGQLTEDYPEVVVEIVENWAKEHIVRTRQSELLKIFPMAGLDIENIVNICPKKIEPRVCDDNLSCAECRKKFWLEEIEDNENN